MPFSYGTAFFSAYNNCCNMKLIHFESGFKSFFYCNRQSLLLIPGSAEVKVTLLSYFLGIVTHCCSTFFVAWNLLFNSTFHFHSHSTYRHSRVMKYKKLLNAVWELFFSIDVNMLYMTLHIRLNNIPLPVLCYVKWQLFQLCVLLLNFTEFLSMRNKMKKVFCSGEM